MDFNLFNLNQKDYHFPVLIREVLTFLDNSDKTIVDCTFGAGGYSESILKLSKARVIAIDRDKNTRVFADILKNKYPDRFFFVQNTFSNIEEVFKQFGLKTVDMIIADLGVSTMQLQNKERGFSLKEEASLSMTMGFNKFTAFDFINKAKEEEISKVIWNYGEEHKSRTIAKAIISFRRKEVISTTIQLKNIIHAALKRKVNKNGKDSATKTFQAIRIHVNSELTELITMLNKAPYLINKNGKIIIVSFHSLEDRLVKIMFNDFSKYDYLDNNLNKFTLFKPKHITLKAKFKILNKKVIIPKDDEIQINKNSSSAKLRALQRIE